MNLTSASRTLSSRVLAAAAALAATTLVFAPTASAEPVPVSYVKLGAGFNDIYNGEDAGSYVFTVNGSEVTAYCADVTKTFNGSANFSVTSAAGSSVPGVAADADTETAAIQVAVWAFTNNITIDANTVPYEPVRTRAQALVAAAASSSAASGPASFALSMTGTLQGGIARFTATLTTDGGEPIAGEALTFRTTSGTEVTGTVETGSAGSASWEVAAADVDALSAEVNWSGSLAAGSVIVPDDGSQPLILAESVAVTRTAAATVDAAAPAPSTPAPAPSTPAPAPSTPANPAATAAPVEELPYTGGSLGVTHLVGALAALAAAAVIVTRMRRGAPA